MKKLLFFVFVLVFILPCFSETIKLKSGKTIDGKIVEKTGKDLKVDIGGVSITYYLDDIESIDEIPPNKKKEEIQSSRESSVGLTLNSIDTEHIRTILKHLGYPENTWPVIEKELTAFLIKIDFSSLKGEAQRVKSSPDEFKKFFKKLGGVLEREGCLDIGSPHPLIKSLIVCMDDDDIFKVIESSPEGVDKKNELKKLLLACSSLSQLGSIILNLLNYDVKTVNAPRHVFNCIPLDSHRFFFADFTWQIFEEVDIDHFYSRAGKYWVLKEEYRVSPEKMQEIKKIFDTDSRPNSLNQTLQYLYLYIYISDDYTVSYVIQNNRAAAYLSNHDYDKAIANCNHALIINPDYPNAYVNRGKAYADTNHHDKAIADLNKALELNPNLVEAYSDLGTEYNAENAYDQAITFFNKSLKIDPTYENAYIGLGFAYDEKGNYDQAISEYNKAIEINPNLAPLYNARGLAYTKKNDFNQAVNDYAKAISINPEYAIGYLNLGTAYDGKGDFDNAIIYYDKAIKIDPDLAEAYYDRGFDYVKKGNYKNALADYNRAIEIKPDFAQAYYGRGGVYFINKDFNNAWSDMHKAESLGLKIDSIVFEDLRKASGREK